MSEFDGFLIFHEIFIARNVAVKFVCDGRHKKHDEYSATIIRLGDAQNI